MNKHGQTLILFVILIPIMLGLMALVIDVGLIVYQKAHLTEVTKTIIKENLSNIENIDIQEKMQDLFIKNDINIDNLKIEIENNKIHVMNEVQIDSIFGAIIGIKTYDIKINILGYEENNKVIIE